MATAWSNPDLQLFHGTSLRYAESIVSRVDVTFRRQKMGDFGKGFYCTTNEEQAREWSKKFAMSDDQPAVVRLVLPRIDLSHLRSLVFLRGDAGDNDYWRFVDFNRNGGVNHGVTNGLSRYDAVFGPVSLNYGRRLLKEGLTRLDQISFHTPDAENLLNDRAKRSILWM